MTGNSLSILIVINITSFSFHRVISNVNDNTKSLSSSTSSSSLSPSSSSSSWSSSLSPLSSATLLPRSIAFMSDSKTHHRKSKSIDYSNAKTFKNDLNEKSNSDTKVIGTNAIVAEAYKSSATAKSIGTNKIDPDTAFLNTGSHQQKPQNLPLQVTIVTLEAENGSKAIKTLPYVQPVMEMAIENVSELYRGRIDFSLVAEVGGCTKEVGVPAARVSCKHNISVFIGTACSFAMETLAYMANTWNVPIITPIANTELDNRTEFPRLTRINNYLQASVVNTIIYVLQLYGWKNVVMFADRADSDSNLYRISLEKRIEQDAKEVNLIAYFMEATNESLDFYTNILRKASKKARVFLVVSLPATHMVKLLYCASQLGYTTNGEFVWLYILDKHPMEDQPFHPSTYAAKNISQSTIDMARKLDFPSQQKQALFFHIDMSERLLPKQFKEELIRRSVQFGVKYTDNYQPTFNLLGYWDAVQIYAFCVNESLTEGGDPFDGLAITKKIWNRTFQGLEKPVTIGDDGDRDSQVTISIWNEDVGQYQTYAMRANKSGNLEFTQPGVTSFPWPLSYGKPPPNEPKCGYSKLSCSDDGKTADKIIASSSVLVVIIIVAIIIVVSLYRRSKRQGEQDLLWWLIQGTELVMASQRTNVGLSTIYSSRASLKGANQVPDIAVTSSTAAYNGTEKNAIYKGQLVRLNRLDIKQVKLTTGLLHDFKQVRELSHNNLVRIHGATVDETCVCLVMEICPKGTLQDLLGSDHVTLDAQFKFSLTMDIIDGLCYIHDCPLKWHGRLTSEVCLVDNRFSVKIAKYGLSSLYDQVELDISSQEYKNSCLWKSPEMLRAQPHPGSRESDIYSLGIILSEIVSREGPFGQEVAYMTMDEILQKISSPMSGAQVFRPTVDVPPKMAYIQDVMDTCWDEDPKNRPSATDVRTLMKKSAGQSSVSVSLIDNLMNRMEQYANNLEILVEDKTEELREEKKRSEELLYQMLPRSVADRLKLGLQIPPEEYDSVTIYFSDIVGFTILSARSTPIEVVTLLNDLYSLFDGILGAYDVYKVETIGDAYMVVSGLPSRNGYMHASNIASMALDLLYGIKSFTIPHLPGEKAKLRIGLHSGPVCAGVVGLKMPRYCLFGDTVNTASRMESHGQELRIHMSHDCKTILDRCGDFYTEKRGLIDIKGKGQMLTYWLTGATGQGQGQRST